MKRFEHRICKRCGTPYTTYYGVEWCTSCLIEHGHAEYLDWRARQNTILRWLDYGAACATMLTIIGIPVTLTALVLLLFKLLW